MMETTPVLILLTYRAHTKHVHQRYNVHSEHVRVRVLSDNDGIQDPLEKVRDGNVSMPNLCSLAQS